jgi:hypothetical protein
MSDEGKRCHEQQEHSSAILRVTVNLPGDPHQPQKTGGLQETNKCGCLPTFHTECTFLQHMPKDIVANTDILLREVIATQRF